MIRRFFRWLFTSAPKAEPAQPRPVERAASFFTSDLDADRPSRGEVVEAARSRAIRVTPAHFVMVNAQGVAMDAASDSWTSNAKAAFNMAAGYVPDAQLLWYSSQSFIGFQMCAILAQQWLIHKACDIPARDAIRNGYRIIADASLPADIVGKLEAADKRYGLKRQCRELVYFSRVFGIRIALFKVDSRDPQYYEKPFNPDGITPGSYRGVVQIDPYWCVPEMTIDGVSDPTNASFYEPTYWTIHGKRYHRSHLVIVRGPEVADVLKPSYQFAGVSLPQRIYERVYAAERTANEGPQLALTKRAMVFYTDTAKALANQKEFRERLQTWADFRDNYGVKVADKAGDQIQQFDTALGDFDETVMTQYQLVAAIANVPATKLLGTTPKGFNASGDYEADSYHEELESIQTNDMEPLVNRHHICVIRSEIAPAAGLAPFTVSVMWEPTDTPSAKEEADIELQKSVAAKNYADAGALDGQDIRARLLADPKSGYDGLGLAEAVPPDAGPHLPGPPVPSTGQATPGGQDGAERVTVALDVSDWNPVTGTYAEAQLITNQDYIDDAIVAAKIAAGDFTVELSPEFVTAAGVRYRIIINGHHSLAAAIRSGNAPVFVEANYVDSDYCNAVTKLPIFGQENGDLT